MPFPTNTISPLDPCRINPVNVQHGMNNGHLSAGNMVTDQLLGGQPIAGPPVLGPMGCPGASRGEFLLPLESH